MKISIIHEEDLMEELKKQSEIIEALRLENMRLRAKLGELQADRITWEARARRMDQLYRTMIDQIYPMEE